MTCTSLAHDMTYTSPHFDMHLTSLSRLSWQLASVCVRRQIRLLAARVVRVWRGWSHWCNGLKHGCYTPLASGALSLEPRPLDVCLELCLELSLVSCACVLCMDVLPLSPCAPDTLASAALQQQKCSSGVTPCLSEMLFRRHMLPLLTHWRVRTGAVT